MFRQSPSGLPVSPEESALLTAAKRGVDGIVERLGTGAWTLVTQLCQSIDNLLGSERAAGLFENLFDPIVARLATARTAALFDRLCSGDTRGG